MKIDSTPYAKTLYVWNSVSAVFFYGDVTLPHSHNTMQLVFDIRKTFKCRLHDHEWGIYKSVLIKENAIHQLDPDNSVQLLLYLDAQSEAAKVLRAKYLSVNDICSLDANILEYVVPGELEQCLIEPDLQLLEKLVYRLLQILAGDKKITGYDERIKAVQQLLNNDGYERVSIQYLAKKVFLSESRLRFLFKKNTGIPLHRYIIWNRIVQAIGMIMNGATVQDAALECGFTDSSHFHKLLLQMFGISPSQFIKNNSKKNIQILTGSPMNLDSSFYDDASGKPTRVYKL